MLTLGEPRIIERGPCQVVGAWHPYEGEDEEPGWIAAHQAFGQRHREIANQVGTMVLGFLYRPHQDLPEVPETVRACFVGVEVRDLEDVPPGLSATRFPGGSYVIVSCTGDTEGEAAGGVGEAINWLNRCWLPEHGYVAPDACFAGGDEATPKPPYVDYVYMRIQPRR